MTGYIDLIGVRLKDKEEKGEIANYVLKIRYLHGGA